MSAIIDQMLEDALNDLGRDVTYTPQVGSAFTLRIMPAQEDAITVVGISQIKSNATLFEARVASFASAPVNGDTITDGATTLKVKNFHRPDEERLLYLLECYPA